jgi:DNA (cytosine-5)-methyltransferase 1
VGGYAERSEAGRCMSTASNRGYRPRLLDLFCGAGGAAMGYSRAGFEVVGVDIKPQPRYPFEFIRGDVLEVLRNGLMHSWHFGPSDERNYGRWFDAIHASPPCQRYSTATKRNGTQDEHPDLIGPTRELLEATGLPYVIENVVGAPLRNPITLCGSHFQLRTDGYRLKRHRQFEANFSLTHGLLFTPCPCRHFSTPIMDVTGGGPTHKPRIDGGGGRPYKGTADQARRIMGIDWMTKAELNEAIPPAYTEFIGGQLMAHISPFEMPALQVEEASIWPWQRTESGL